MTVLAQATGDGAIPWETFLNYGVLGLVFLLFLAGYLYPKPMIQHLQNENERLRLDNEKVRDENTKLRAGIEERVVPAMVRVTDLLSRMGGGS